jgi:sugar phosphate permease
MLNKTEFKLRNRALSEQNIINHYRTKVFSLTFIAYALSHLSRKAYTTCKVEMKDAGLDPLILSAMDTVFMFCYALGSVIGGHLGDTYHAPTIIGLGYNTYHQYHILIYIHA